MAIRGFAESEIRFVFTCRRFRLIFIRQLLELCQIFLGLPIRHVSMDLLRLRTWMLMLMMLLGVVVEKLVMIDAV